MAPKKSEQTRCRIIAAARRIFCAYPYDAASVRKIEQAGGVNYALIRYYFGSKKGLFDTVAAELVREYIDAIYPMLGILNQEPLEESLAIFIDRLLDYCFRHPDGTAIIMLNIGKSSQFDDTLLGLEAIKTYIAEIQRQVAGIAPHTITDRHRAMIVLAFILITVNSVGAAEFYARGLNLPPNSPQYRQWVKEAIHLLFSPLINNVFSIGDIPASRLSLAEISQPPRPEETAALPGKPSKTTKGDLTRKRILDAAQTVFTRNPYPGASIRMIGREGGFDFTLIHHYFPTKEKLATAVINRFYEEFFRESHQWMADFFTRDIATMTLRKSLEEYLRHLLDFYFDKPDAPAILMQNIVPVDNPDLAHMYDYFRRFYTDILHRLKTILLLRAPEEKIRMWQFFLVMVIINCVGASHYLTRILEMTGNNNEYRQWVNEFLVYIFFPELAILLTQ